MTKDDLKKLTDTRDELELLDKDIERQEQIVYNLRDKRQTFADTVVMSSNDEACRPVTSRVTSYASDKNEAPECTALRRMQAEREDLQEQYDKLQAAVEAWIGGLGDGRIRRILRARYILGDSIREVAERMGYSYQTAANLESRFWSKNGK